MRQCARALRNNKDDDEPSDLDDLDDFGLAFSIAELRDVLDGYLVHTGRRLARRDGDHAA